MSTEVKLPALGESVSEGTVSRWLKQVGDQVDVDEPLLEVSTDKVDTEVPSTAAGVVLEIRVKEDETASVGQVLAVIGDPSEASAAPAPVAEVPAPPVPPASAPVPPAPTPVPPAPAEPKLSCCGGAPKRGEEAPYATPLVRKIAEDNGISLAEVTGTGVGGRIRKEDVLAAAEAKKAPATPAPAVPAPKPGLVIPGPSAKAGTVEPMSKIRQVVAKRMVDSLAISAQLTATVEVDLTAISKLRDRVKDEFRAREGVGLTYLAFIAKAVSEALREFPMVNSSANMEEKTITYGASENVGIAVDTPKGLFVPVIHDCSDLTVAGIAKRIGDLAKKAREGKLTPPEMAGGTFTVTNYGSTGTLFDTPIINQPQVAILGTGAMVKRPVVVTDELGNDSIAIRHMMYLSLTYDHRLVDGADAGRFLSYVKTRLEGAEFGAEFGV